MASKKVALNVICRNEEKNIAKCLTSAMSEVDAIFILDTGSTDKTVELCKKLGATVFEVGDKYLYKATKKDEKWVKDHLGPHTFLRAGDKLFRFSEARNDLLSRIPKEYEWILWLDADDMFRGKGSVQKMIDLAEEQNAQMVFLNYLYQCDFNPDGSIQQVLVEHLKDRLFKNDGTYQWKGEIHETLVDQKDNKKMESDLADVVHLSQVSKMTVSINRNIRNLEYEIITTKAEDPRPIHYLAKAYYDLKDDEHLKEVIRLEKSYLEGSGWKEERAEAWEYIAWVYNKFRKYDQALKACMNALLEDPNNPSTVVTLAQTYMLKRDWANALFWIKISAHIPQPRTSLVTNPMDLITRSLEVIYQASIQTQKLDEAWAAMRKLIDIYPTHEPAKKEWKFVSELKEEKELTVKAIEIARYLHQNGQKEKIRQLIYSLPNHVQSNQMITNLSQQVFPPRTWKEKELVIFVGPGFEQWSPKTIEEQGSGGSEEAVYRLSQSFSTQGWKVIVYAEPGAHRGNHNGVEYKNFYEMNWNDHFNVLVSWRRPNMMDVNMKAKKHYLWLHDIPMVREFTPERLKKVDKVIVLSEFHGSLLNTIEVDGKTFGVPKDKLMISRNGVSI